MSLYPPRRAVLKSDAVFGDRREIRELLVTRSNGGSREGFLVARIGRWNVFPGIPSFSSSLTPQVTTGMRYNRYVSPGNFAILKVQWDATFLLLSMK